jgi:hypothetical protein
LHIIADDLSLDNLPSLKKSAGSARRLSRNLSISHGAEGDDDDDEVDGIDRLTSAPNAAEESHLDRLKSRRWSISLPKSFGNDDEDEATSSALEGDENADSSKASANTKRKTKRQPTAAKVKEEGAVAIMSPEKKRVNNQATPDLAAVKGSRTRKVAVATTEK